MRGLELGCGCGAITAAGLRSRPATRRVLPSSQPSSVNLSCTKDRWLSAIFIVSSGGGSTGGAQGAGADEGHSWAWPEAELAAFAEAAMTLLSAMLKTAGGRAGFFSRCLWRRSNSALSRWAAGVSR